MPTLYLTEEYALVRRDSEDCLLVQVPERRGDGDGKNYVPSQKRRIPLIKIEHVIVMGEITLTSSALHLLLEKKIEIHFLDKFGTFKGNLSPGLSKNAMLRLAQHRAHHSVAQRGELAKRFIIGKLSNQRMLMQRHNRRQTDHPFDQHIQQLANIIQRIQTFPIEETIAPTLMTGDTGIHGTPIEEMMGLEGAGSALYFQCLKFMFSDQEKWPFPGRVKRPPTDPINALLSYGYTLLAGRMASAAQIVGFDPYIGYLHSSAYGRPALALDLMEEFRPLIVDSVVIALLNNRMLSPDDFQQELGAYRLKKEPRKVFLTKFEERLNEEVMHPVFAYKTKYKQCMELQARLVAKYLTGEIPSYAPFVMR